MVRLCQGTAVRWFLLRCVALSASEPFPPLSAVLQCPLYKSETYASLRDKLVTPIPAPEVKFGGQFLTVDLHPAKVVQPAQPATPSSSAATATVVPGSPTEAPAIPAPTQVAVHVLSVGVRLTVLVAQSRWFVASVGKRSLVG
jgi:hypothetical protein